MREVYKAKLEKVMERRGLGAKPLSKEAGLNETFIRDMFQKGADPSIGKFMKIADALNLPMAFFFDEDDPPPPPRIPLIGYAAGGDGWVPFDDSQIAEDIDLDLGGAEAVAIRVTGHSMSPAYRDGDDIICAKFEGAELIKALNRDCVLKTADGKYFIKQLLKGTVKNTYRLRSYNPDYEDIDKVALEWAAPVIWVRRKQ